MKTERELFLYELEGRGYKFENKTWIHGMGDVGGLFDDDQLDMAWEMWCASASREGYVVVPVEPTEEMWGGLARHLVKYMQSHDRYCPKTLGKYINRFIGFKNIPDWLNKEIPDWESDHAFATADLGVFIYKSMIEAA